MRFNAMFKRLFTSTKWILLLLALAVQGVYAIDDNQNLQAFVPDGLSYSYETDTGIKRTESAQVKNLQVPVVVYSGSYSYTDADGGQVLVEYVADENGYVPHVKIVGRREEAPVVGYPAAGGALIASLVG